VRGLQIINGAQRVNAIHTVYSELGELGRKDLDDKVLLLLRIYISGGEEFDRNVTKYTNYT
jgi:hypothetical protein